jgi:hypothetical protein
VTAPPIRRYARTTRSHASGAEERNDRRRAEVDVLREIAASIDYSTDSGPEEIDSARGWIGWRVDDEDLITQLTP